LIYKLLGELAKHLLSRVPVIFT